MTHPDPLKARLVSFEKQRQVRQRAAGIGLLEGPQPDASTPLGRRIEDYSDWFSAQLGTGLNDFHRMAIHDVASLHEQAGYPRFYSEERAGIPEMRSDALVDAINNGAERIRQAAIVALRAQEPNSRC